MAEKYYVDGVNTMPQQVANNLARIKALEEELESLKTELESLIVANPTAEGTVDLTKVTIKDTTYNVAGGSTVVANPTGTASDTLDSIEIDGTIYDTNGDGSEVVVTASSDGKAYRITVDESTYGLLYTVSNSAVDYFDFIQWTPTSSVTYQVPSYSLISSIRSEVQTAIDTAGSALTTAQSASTTASAAQTTCEELSAVMPTDIVATKTDNTVSLSLYHDGTAISGQTAASFDVGGGTEVVANPSETGTTDLSKLQVGDTVYNVPSGGTSSNVKTYYYTDISDDGEGEGSEYITLNVGQEIDENSTILIKSKTMTPSATVPSLSLTIGTENVTVSGFSTGFIRVTSAGVGSNYTEISAGGYTGSSLTTLSGNAENIVIRSATYALAILLIIIK